MAEIVTTRPDLVIALLEGQGARCGAGVQPSQLAGCPPESFCWLDGTEICVHGPSHDMCAASAGAPSSPAGAIGTLLDPHGPPVEPAASNGSTELSAIAILLCVLAGVALAARRREHHVFSAHHAHD